MQQNNRANQKTFLNSTKKTIAYNLENIRFHLDYADIIYDRPFDDAFKEKLEKFTILQHLLLLDQ